MTDFNLMKLGKNPAVIDERTIKMASILRLLPSYPEAFDVDSQYPNLKDTHMFKNDTLGDCVIAGRAHQTLRLENYEQGTVIPISDSDVTTEYFKESGGQDTGLNMLDALNAWRTGWRAASNVYNIYAYASINVKDWNEVRATCYLLNGIYIGLQLPISAQTQSTWDVVSGPNAEPGSWGGHCVYIVAYDNDGLTCMTWGKRQKMTWQFYQKYSDESFGIVDNKDSWVANDALDIAKLENILNQITGGNIPPPTPPVPPVPPKKRCIFSGWGKKDKLTNAQVKTIRTDLSLGITTITF